MAGDLADVITCAKFQDDIFRGYNFTGWGRISHFLLIFAWALQQRSATALSVILPEINGGFAKCCSETLYAKWTCHETYSRSVEWNLEWHVYWDNLHEIWRYGYKRGIIRLTLKPETLKIWGLSLHTCSRLEEDLADISSPEKKEGQGKHKEENKGRIESNAKDRESIRRKLSDARVATLEFYKDDVWNHHHHHVYFKQQGPYDRKTTHNEIKTNKKYTQWHKTKDRQGMKLKKIN